jgi:septum formation protein
MTLVLASTSASRRALLEAAAIPHEALAPNVDEAAVKESMVGAKPRDLADALAEMKAIKLSKRLPGAMVLGGDQVLVTDDGVLLDKPVSRADAEAQLRMLSGRRHRLIAAAVIAEQGRAVWRAVEEVQLTMRELGDGFIADYLDSEWPAISGCVGGYRIEGRGVQLFSRIDGSQFAILGLPMLALLTFLRDRGVLLT